MKCINPYKGKINADCTIVEHMFPFNSCTYVVPHVVFYDGMKILSLIINIGNITLLRRQLDIPRIVKYGEIADFELSTPVK